MLSLKSFRTAAITLAGIELAHRVRKRKFSFGVHHPGRFSSLKHYWASGLARHDAAINRGEASVGRPNRHCTRTHNEFIAC